MYGRGPYGIGVVLGSMWVEFERGTIEIEREYDEHGRDHRAIREEIFGDFRAG